MYTFAPKLRLAAIILMVLGLILFAVGFAVNAGNGEDYVVEQLAQHPDKFPGEHASAEHAEGAAQSEHVQHLLHQYHNKPWTALYMAAFLFTGIAAASMFFLAVQHASQSGWSVIITRVMEGIATFVPYGGAILLIVLFASAFHGNHLFHWMDKDLYDFNSPNFDKYLKTKESWLNVPFWLIRSVLYIAGWTFFTWMLKKRSKILDEHGTEKNYWTLYRWAVLTIVFFALTSMSSGWDWVMSIDPHWYSTLFGWYVMVSYLVSAVAVMILISIHLKRQGALPEFNDNHLHDLAKYLFGFSLLWGYLWVCQFLLIWYANIPEESVYFLARDKMYDWSYYRMLIPNVVLPFLVLISSSIKRNYKVVSFMAFVVILGHWWDVFNQMMPGTVGPWGSFGMLEFGALFFMAGFFIFVVMTTLTKLKLRPVGNPLYHESKIFHYPF